MKNILIASLLIAAQASCNKSKKNIPDVAGIKVDMTVHRFEQDLFALDTNNLQPGLSGLYKKYPELSPIFFRNILGLPVDSSGYLADTEGLTVFIRLSKPIQNDVKKEIKDFAPVQKNIEAAFQFVKYYFPAYKIPTISTIVGPPDALAEKLNGEPSPNFITNETIGISLQFYMGRDNNLYQGDYFVQNVAPAYRSRRFSKEYIAADVMKLIVEDLFPDKSGGQPLIEQMVEKGKQWFLLDKFMPTTADSLKTGYTQQQLDWCTENEGLIWSHIVKNEDLQSLTPAVIQTYIGEAPFTQGFSPEYSPGNIGQWIGWQIVKKFADKNSKLRVEDIMRTPAAKIIEEAKYRPK